MHTVGFPTSQEAYAGGFLYTMAPNLVHIGYIVGLDYKNPHMNLYQEFQLYKNHPKIRALLEKGKCLKYGARVINEGGYYAIPKLNFPGGALIGCSAGFVNVAKIKGTHNAMKTGMMAAEAIIQKIEAQSGIDNVKFGEELFEYSDLFKSSWVHEEMYRTRNVKGSFSHGLIRGMIRSFFILTISKGREIFQFLPKGRDSASMDNIDK
jgi:electron-transferring-flavoprotein dehydrogenase